MNKIEFGQITGFDPAEIDWVIFLVLDFLMECRMGFGGKMWEVGEKEKEEEENEKEKEKEKEKKKEEEDGGD